MLAKTSNGGVVQKFQVPAGATRLYIGIWDGVDFNNNAGSISGQITTSGGVQIVQ